MLATELMVAILVLAERMAPLCICSVHFLFFLKRIIVLLCSWSASKRSPPTGGGHSYQSYL